MKQINSSTLLRIVCRRTPASVLLVRPVTRRRAAQSALGFIVCASDGLAGAVRLLGRWAGREREQLPLDHLPRQFIDQQAIVVFGAILQRRLVRYPYRYVRTDYFEEEVMFTVEQDRDTLRCSACGSA